MLQGSSNNGEYSYSESDYSTKLCSEQSDLGKVTLFKFVIQSTVALERFEM